MLCNKGNTLYVDKQSLYVTIIHCTANAIIRSKDKIHDNSTWQVTVPIPTPVTDLPP
uniref:Uncharacterized protein n=1 Tax=Arundo donax TaxID=35708 RepID=A0A0A9H859_ARUDO